VVSDTARSPPYVPLAAGRRGMTYATLRPCHDTGVFVMPAGRDRLADLLAASSRPAKDRRQCTVDLREPAGSAGGTGGSGWIDLAQAPDGLRIAVTGVSARAAAPPVTVGGSGGYLLVVSGAVDDGGEQYEAGSITWRAAGDSVRSQAAAGGARLALLQFPCATAA
jgi:hypothetical protein